jgi:hypothetical protein
LDVLGLAGEQFLEVRVAQHFRVVLQSVRYALLLGR